MSHVTQKICRVIVPS